MLASPIVSSGRIHPPSTETCQHLLTWAKHHRRDRIFTKDEKIPIRPGLVYFIAIGLVRLEGRLEYQLYPKAEPPDQNLGMFLGLVEAQHPFYWASSQSVTLTAYAHLDQTQVIWLYWSELNQWQGLDDWIGHSILQQHQHYLSWLSLFGQKRTHDRLLGFLVLLAQTYGIPCTQGIYLPYLLTHTQIGRAIGATRVTVTRLLGRLKEQGVLTLYQDQFLCILTLRSLPLLAPISEEVSR
jgi:hypothetical protein